MGHLLPIEPPGELLEILRKLAATGFARQASHPTDVE